MFFEAADGVILAKASCGPWKAKKRFLERLSCLQVIAVLIGGFT